MSNTNSPAPLVAPVTLVDYLAEAARNTDPTTGTVPVAYVAQVADAIAKMGGKQSNNYRDAMLEWVEVSGDLRADEGIPKACVKAVNAMVEEVTAAKGPTKVERDPAMEAAEMVYCLLIAADQIANRLTDDEAERFVKVLADADISVPGSFVIGIPSGVDHDKARARIVQHLRLAERRIHGKADSTATMVPAALAKLGNSADQTTLCRQIEADHPGKSVSGAIDKRWHGLMDGSDGRADEALRAAGVTVTLEGGTKFWHIG